MDTLLSLFLTETMESLDGVEAALVTFEQAGHDTGPLDHILRLVHNIKGTCGFMRLPRMEAMVHAAEAAIAALKHGGTTPQAITAILGTIDRIKDIVVALEHEASEPSGDDEAILLQLAQIATRAGGPALQTKTTTNAAPHVTAHQSSHELRDAASALGMLRHQLAASAERLGDAPLASQVQLLTAVCDDLEKSVDALRHQPVGKAWALLPRIVRGLSEELGKIIALELCGGDIAVEAQVVAALKAPMAQLIRNAASHGLETPQERRAAGKADAGQIKVTAAVVNGALVVRVADDGRGIGVAAVKRKAVQSHAMSAEDAERMTTSATQDLLFSSGFSTSDRADKISGHGIGLNVVRAGMDALGGTIAMTSKPGKGTIFTLKIPLAKTRHAKVEGTSFLSFAAAPVPHDDMQVSFILFKACDGSQKAVPFQLVSRVEQANQDMIETIGGRRVLRLAGSDMPLIGTGETEADNGADFTVLVFNDRGRKFGLLVDAVIDVVKAEPKLEGGAAAGVIGVGSMGHDKVDVIDIAYYMSAAFGEPQVPPQSKTVSTRRNYPVAWSSAGRNYTNGAAK